MMVSRKEWYRRTEALWPAHVPVPSAEDAIRGAKKLWRFVRGSKCPYPVVATSGNRATWVHGGELRVNPDCNDGRGGWRALVHDLSHYLGPGGGHTKEHARLEARMIREVIKRGWLKPAAAPDPGWKAIVTREAINDEKLGRIRAGIERWEAKKRRAENALKKLRRRARYYERIKPVTTTDKEIT